MPEETSCETSCDLPDPFFSNLFDKLPKIPPPFRYLWEDAPVDWHEFFWGAFWAYLMAHPLFFYVEQLDLFIFWICWFLLVLYPMVIAIIILFRSFSWPALLKTGIAFCFLVSVIMPTTVWSVFFIKYTICYFYRLL